MAMTATQKELESPHTLRRCGLLEIQGVIIHRGSSDIQALSTIPPTSPLAQPPPVYTRGAFWGWCAPFAPDSPRLYFNFSSGGINPASAVKTISEEVTFHIHFAKGGRLENIQSAPVMSVKFDNNRRGKNTGFSIAIGLCLAAVCLVATSTAINNRAATAENDDYISEYVSEVGDDVWLGVEDTDEDSEVSDDITETEPVSQQGYDEDFTGEAEAVQGTLPAQGIETDEAESVTSDTGSDTPSTENLALSGEDDAVTASKTISYRMPVNGEIIKKYSGEELVYCSTMSDWRVHQGVDISATPDCEVYAAADGIVVGFSEDMLYGYTAIIEHDDGSMLYYCGLASVPMVTQGLEVHAGDVIGYLGVVPCEANDPPHLHLAMMKDGVFVDPISTMGL